MYWALRKLLFSLDPELAHELVKTASFLAPKSLLKLTCQTHVLELKASLGKTRLTSPIGLAAGFDKNGELLSLLQTLGFGFLELGSVTAMESLGNPKPRVFRLPIDESMINRMGLPNWGADKFATHLAKQKLTTPIGINIAKTPGSKNGIDDFAKSFQTLHHLGCYVVFNLSCPNTADGKTFEDPILFAEFAAKMAQLRQELSVTKPILVKLSPDTDTKAVHKIVEESLKQGFDGFVVSNTSSTRNELATDVKTIEKTGRGGLSGKALLTLATQQLKTVHEIVGNKKILIGVGGIMALKDVLAKFAAGAQLVQIYTGFIYGGPFFVKGLNRGLTHICQNHGLKSYRELIGNKEAVRLSAS